jgi:hypothetical protein
MRKVFRSQRMGTMFSAGARDTNHDVTRGRCSACGKPTCHRRHGVAVRTSVRMAKAMSARQTTGESPEGRESNGLQVLVDNKSVVETGERYRSEFVREHSCSCSRQRLDGLGVPLPVTRVGSSGCRKGTGGCAGEANRRVSASPSARKSRIEPVEDARVGGCSAP